MNYDRIDHIYHLIFIIFHNWKKVVAKLCLIANFLLSLTLFSLSNYLSIYSHKCHSDLTVTISTIVARPLMGKSTYFTTRFHNGSAFGSAIGQRIWIWFAAISSVYLL